MTPVWMALAMFMVACLLVELPCEVLDRHCGQVVFGDVLSGIAASPA
jgi:hypothetical protein